MFCLDVRDTQDCERQEQSEICIYIYTYIYVYTTHIYVHISLLCGISWHQITPVMPIMNSRFVKINLLGSKFAFQHIDFYVSTCLRTHVHIYVPFFIFISFLSICLMYYITCHESTYLFPSFEHVFLCISKPPQSPLPSFSTWHHTWRGRAGEL